MDGGLRGPLTVAAVAALGVILALVEDTIARVALGLMVGLLLARAAMTPMAGVSAEGPPEGLDERRHDHLFRHWLNVLIKKIREFHTICQGIREEKVNMTAAQIKVRGIENEIQNLLIQVTDTAKPGQLRQQARGAGGQSGSGSRERDYGESPKDGYDYD